MKEYSTSLHGSATAVAPQRSPERSPKPRSQLALPFAGAHEGILEHDPTLDPITREKRRLHTRLASRHPEHVSEETGEIGFTADDLACRDALRRAPFTGPTTSQRRPLGDRNPSTGPRAFFCSASRANGNGDIPGHLRRSTETSANGPRNATLAAQLLRRASELRARLQRLIDQANDGSPSGLFDRRWIP